MNAHLCHVVTQLFITRNIIWVCPDRWAGSDPIVLAELSSGAANVSSVKQAAVALIPVPLTGAHAACFLLALLWTGTNSLLCPPSHLYLELLLHSALQLFLSVVVRRLR
jgi:hypothetical protein